MVVVSHTSITEHAPMGVYYTEEVRQKALIIKGQSRTQNTASDTNQPITLMMVLCESEVENERVRSL